LRAAGEHLALVAALDVDPAATRRLAAYLDLLASWSQRINLTGARTAAARVDLLVRPVVPLAPAVLPGTLLDLGSGNGSPGLVLAALRPDILTTLLEPRMRRWAFLRDAARTMGLGIVVRRQRHDEYDGPPATNVTLRALRLPPGEIIPLLAPGGRLFVLGAEPPPHPALTPVRSGPVGVHVFARPR